jgi:hypothetical protein
MVAAVVLNDEPRRGVKKVRPTDKLTIRIAHIGLDFGVRQPTLNEQPSKAGLHRRLGWCCQPGQ